MYKVAYIEWIDASGSHETLGLDEVLKSNWDLKMYTSGILLEESEEKVIIAQDVFRSLHSEDSYRCRDIEVIPRQYITKIQIFSPSGKK